MAEYWWLILPLFLVVALTFLALYKRRAKPHETAMESYVEGLRLLTTGDEQTAFIKFRQAVDQDTGNIDAYLKMGDIFRNRGLTDKALQVHRELNLRRNVPPDIQTEIDKSLVMDYIKADLPDKAYAMLAEMRRNSSSRFWASERLFELYIRDNKWKDAGEVYEEIAKRGGKGDSSTLAGLKLLVGRELHDNEEFHKARLIYKEALSLDKTNPLPYLYIAESYLQEKRVEDGLEFLRRLCEEMPRNAHLGFPLLEETLFQLGRYGEIEDIYRGVLGKDPSNTAAKIALAGILEKKGELAMAESMLRSVLDVDQVNALAAIRLANILVCSRKSNEGLEILSNLADKIDHHNQEFKCRACGKSSTRLLPACSQCGTIGTYI